MTRGGGRDGSSRPPRTGAEPPHQPPPPPPEGGDPPTGLPPTPDGVGPPPRRESTPGGADPAPLPPSTRGGPLVLPALGLAQGTLLAAVGWWPGATWPWPALPMVLGAFALYVAAAGRAGAAAGGTAVIWVVALALRAALLPLPPELSDDVWRYLWDGRVQASGVNPYLHAPAAAEVAGLRTPWHALINNPEVPTIYPPVAQLAFRALALVAGTVLGAKLLFIAFDLATGWVLGRVAAGTGRDARPVLLLWLWSPLLVLEVAWSAHLEPLGLFFLALALLLAHSGPLRALASAGVGSALALSALVKFAPLAAVPPLLRRFGLPFLGALLATGAVLYLPFAGAGTALFDGLRTYAGHWRFMEGPFVLLEAVLPGRTAPRVAAGLLVLAVVAWTTHRRFEAERALLWILGTGLLLTPTLHPWYALWILPMAALRGSPPWILLTGLSFLGYWGLDVFQATGQWPQPAWLRLLLWGPVLALLAGEAWFGRRSPAPPSGGSAPPPPPAPRSRPGRGG